MLIISKFKDYYDSIAYSKGVDKTIVYNREVTVFKDYSLTRKKQWHEHLPYYSTRGVGFTNCKDDKVLRVNIVGFCGKLYPMCVYNKRIDQYTDKKTFIYDYDEIYNLFKNVHNKDNKSWIAEFDYLNKILNDKRIQNLFFEYKTPIFYINQDSGYYSRKYDLDINTHLNDIDFVKVFDPYSAFQEIEMFISGVLGIDSQKTIEVSDKSKIEGRGFDYKYSFRKEKQ